MTENKPYQISINERGQLDIIDHIESKKRNTICIYNDLGVHPFSSAKALCDLLNEKEEQIKSLKIYNIELEDENIQLEEQIKDLKCRINNIYAILREERCGDE